MSSLPALAQLTPEQIALRTQGITATDVAKVLGVAPARWGSPMSVWAEKVMGPDPSWNDMEESERLLIGRAMEPAVLALYQHHNHDVYVERCEETLRHRTEQWMLATPDALCTDDEVIVGLAEAKTAGLDQSHQWSDSGEVPRHYLVQCAWQMAVTELPWVDLAALVGGTKFRIVRIERDMELEEFLVERMRTFREKYVETEKPPPITEGSEATRKALERVWPHDNGETLHVTDPAILRQIELYHEAYAKAKAAEEHKQGCAADLQRFMGDTRKLTTDGHGSIIWYGVTRKRTDWKTIAETLATELDVPDELMDRLQKENTTETSYRAFRGYPPK